MKQVKGREKQGQAVEESANEETKGVAKGAIREAIEKSASETAKEATNVVTFVMLRDRLIELARDGKREMVRALLNRYGVRLLTELPREKYEEIFEEVIKW